MTNNKSLLRYRILKIKLKDLEHFSESKLFLESKIVALSKNRILSYMNNPRAENNDTILYLAVIEKEIIAFRSLLPDFMLIKSKKIRFAWFSGSWVDERHRRKGVSTALMDEAFNDWEEKLLYTNYAPASKSLYDKSKRFTLLIEKTGIRLYFKVKLSELLPPKNTWFRRTKPLLKATDYLSNFISVIYMSFIKDRKSLFNKNISISDRPTVEQYEFIEHHNKSIFGRGKDEYKWIFNYPWITTYNNETRPYPFSHYAKSFFYKTLTAYNGNEIIGIAVIKVRDDKLDVPVFISLNTETSKALTRSIINICYSNDVSTLTCFHENFINSINDIKHIALFRKKMKQKYYISKSMKNNYITSTIIHTIDGDGDYIFT